MLRASHSTAPAFSGFVSQVAGECAGEKGAGLCGLHVEGLSPQFAMFSFLGVSQQVQSTLEGRGLQSVNLRWWSHWEPSQKLPSTEYYLVDKIRNKKELV